MITPEYMERDEILQRLIEIGGCDAKDEWAKGYDSAIDAAISIIENTPAADVVPVDSALSVQERTVITMLKKTNICPVCGKTFIPAPLHKYKIQHNKRVCSYKCLRQWESAADTCVCCGAIVPEGRQVCWRCENDN